MRWGEQVPRDSREWCMKIQGSSSNRRQILNGNKQQQQKKKTLKGFRYFTEGIEISDFPRVAE